MERKTRRIHLGENKVRYRTIIESPDCPVNSAQAKTLQFKLLQALVENPSLLNCGQVPFQRLSMSHNGMRWVVDADAEVEEKETP